MNVFPLNFDYRSILRATQPNSNLSFPESPYLIINLNHSFSIIPIYTLLHRQPFKNTKQMRVKMFFHILTWIPGPEIYFFFTRNTRLKIHLWHTADTIEYWDADANRVLKIGQSVMKKWNESKQNKTEQIHSPLFLPVFDCSLRILTADIYRRV